MSTTVPSELNPLFDENSNVVRTLKIITESRTLNDVEQEYIANLFSFVGTKDFEEPEVKAFATLMLDYLKCLDILGKRAKLLGLSVSLTYHLFENPLETIQGPDEGESLLDLLLNLHILTDQED